MKYFLGVDGGGTKTALCLIDSDLNIVAQSVVSASSLDTISIDESMKTILDGYVKLNVKYELTSVFIGLGGTNSTNLNEFYNKLKKETIFNNVELNVGNDVINALYGGLGQEDGIICISGTGSVVYGIKDKKEHRCGGYAWQEGDIGSSYDLGRQALKYLGKVLDKRLSPSSFSDDLQNKLNINNFDDLSNYFVNSKRTSVAQIARIVTANEDNEIAKEIIERSVNGLVEMINTVYNQLNFSKSNLCIIGSLGNANTHFNKYLHTQLNLTNKNITITANKYEADYGAALKAYTNYKEKA